MFTFDCRWPMSAGPGKKDFLLLVTDHWLLLLHMAPWIVRFLRMLSTSSTLIILSEGAVIGWIRLRCRLLFSSQNCSPYYRYSSTASLSVASLCRFCSPLVVSHLNFRRIQSSRECLSSTGERTTLSMCLWTDKRVCSGRGAQRRKGSWKFIELSAPLPVKFSLTSKPTVSFVLLAAGRRMVDSSISSFTVPNGATDTRAKLSVDSVLIWFDFHFLCLFFGPIHAARNAQR